MRFLARLNERLLNWLARTNPSRREIVVATFFLLVLLGAGTFGYVQIEGWHWIDALYMTFITLSTIGFGEVEELSVAGRFFTIFIGLVGIGIVAYIATRSAQLLLTDRHLRQRQLIKRIRRMEGHYIVCGYGNIGRRIAQDLDRARRPFVVIDRDGEVVEDLQEASTPYIQGDAEEEETLREAGLERARGLILTLPEDSTNVFVALVARELNPKIFILARTNNRKNRSKLLHAGANKVISPDEIGADRMAQVILRPHVDRFMEHVLQTGALGLHMEEVVVEAGAQLDGRSLAQAQFRQQFDAVVVALIGAEAGEMKFNPSANDLISAGDVLIVLGSHEMIERLREDGCTA